MIKPLIRKLKLVGLAALLTHTAGAQQQVLDAGELNRYVGYFNSIDTETVINHVPNKDAAAWLAQNVPFFNCPDTLLERTYYYRWWTFRKHLKATPDGFVFTEFITPVNHAGKYNTVSSGLGHHINEGRWLRNRQYLDQYIRFWLFVDPKTNKPHLRLFSSWLQYALFEHYKTTGDKAFLAELVPALVKDYYAWEAEKSLPGGMYWQYDVRDAMEESISGGRKQKNVRPTINSYMFGNAQALAQMGRLFGNDTLQANFTAKANSLRRMVQDSLWDDTASFFKAMLENRKWSDAREAIGYIPWYFNLPADKKQYARAWAQFTDERGFRAPWGLTTAERRHPLFRTHGSGHGCEWDGAVWPYASTQTLKGLANLLTGYKHHGGLKATDYYDELYKYAWSHQKRGLPYLGEYQDEKNGEWLKGDNPRSSYYNHSGFTDLVISDLVGIKPRADEVLELHPLVPAGKWDWFCLDGVPYHGCTITVLWDKDGTHYGKGKGLRLFADGRELYSGKQLKPVKVALPAGSAVATAKSRSGL